MINTTDITTPRNIIEEYFGVYKDIVELQKSITGSSILVNRKKTNSTKSPIFGKTDVKHVSFPEKMELYIEVNNTDFGKFKLCLFNRDFAPFPLIRYDSFGPSHRNDLPGHPLDKQRIPTPHFHRYNSDGIEYAYRPSVLENDAQTSALKDISFCTSYFCSETKILIPNTVAEVDIKKDGMSVINPYTEEDPLENIIF